MPLIEGENRIRVRSVDLAENRSDDDQLVIIRDTTPPPTVDNLDADAGNGEITVSWDPPAGVDDVVGYEVFYGPPDPQNDCNTVVLANYNGQSADQGGSPIDVGANTEFRLTGLATGTPICVGVRAYDDVNDGAFDAFGVELLPNEMAPRVVGTWPAPAGSAVRAVAISDGVMFVAHGCFSSASCGQTGFSAVDISDPDNPTTLSSCTNVRYSGMFDISILGNYAYVANGTRVEAIDISDPRNISCGNAIAVPDAGAANYDWAVGVAATIGDGNGPASLVVAALDEGIYTYSLANPVSPVLEGQFSLAAASFRALAPTLQGDYAYVAHEAFPTSAGVNIVDISDVTNPTAAGLDIALSPTWDVAVSGSRVAAAANGGVYMFEVPDPTQALTLNSLSATTSRSGQPVDVTIEGPYIYTVDSDGFNQRHNIDVLAQRNLDEVDPDLPLAGRSHLTTPLGQVQLCTAVPCGTHPNITLPSPRRMAVDGMYLYEAHGTIGVVIRRLARPVTLEEINNESFNAPVANDPGGIGVEVYGHRLLFGRNGHLAPVDISDPTAPEQQAPTSIENFTTILERVNDRFLVGGGNGVSFVRPNPDNTFTVTSSWADGNGGRYTKKIEPRYPYLYVVDGTDTYYAPNAQLQTVDVRTNSTVDTDGLGLGTGFWYADHAYWRDTLYVSAAATSSVAVVDLSDPADPSVGAALTVGVSSYGLQVHRERLLVSIANNVRSYALDTPLAPADEQSLGVTAGRWVRASGDYLVGAYQPQGAVIDVADLANAQLIGYGGNIALEMNVYLLGKHMVLTDRHDYAVIELE